MFKTAFRAAAGSDVRTAVHVTSITIALCVAALSSACTPGVAASHAEAPAAALASNQEWLSRAAPQPPFDETPVTPVESAGASRAE